MKILAIDTSGVACGACIYDSDVGRMLALFNETLGKGHAERLMDIVGSVMDEAGIGHSDLGRVVVCTGPGSFTGVRVGVATARGFGLGLGIPVIGVNLLEAIMAELKAAGEEGAALGTVLKTGREEVYALFNADTPFAGANEPFVAGIGELADCGLATDRKLVLGGSAAAELAERIGENARDAGIDETGLLETITRLGADRPDDRSRPEPLYLRKPDAKPQEKFALQRA